MQIGPKRVRREKIILEPGRVVAVYTKEYFNHWPQIGEIMDIDEECITLQWYNATYTGICTKAMLDGKDWMDQISRDLIISDPFMLTPSGKLPHAIVEVLKQQQVNLNIELRRSIKD